MCTVMNAKHEIENKHVSELQLYVYRSMSLMCMLQEHQQNVKSCLKLMMLRGSTMDLFECSQICAIVCLQEHENEELRKTCEILMQSHSMQMDALREQQSRGTGTF